MKNYVKNRDPFSSLEIIMLGFTFGMEILGLIFLLYILTN